LEKHINEHVQLQVFTYYGQNRTSNVKQLAENDIVLTTYQTLASDSKVHLITASSAGFCDVDARPPSDIRDITLLCAC